MDDTWLRCHRFSPSCRQLHFEWIMRELVEGKSVSLVPSQPTHPTLGEWERAIKYFKTQRIGSHTNGKNESKEME